LSQRFIRREQPPPAFAEELFQQLISRAVSAFEPPQSNELGLRASHSSSFQNTERDGGTAHMVKAPCGGGNVLAHARSSAKEVPEFVVTATISSC